eukprot:COSAG01_NODE_6402_length_3685_cov_161.988846_1_plen_186_part_10
MVLRGGLSLALPLRLQFLAVAVTAAAPPAPDVWYGPNPLLPGAHIRGDFFGNVSDIEGSWPVLSGDVTTFKIFLDMLYGPPGTPDLPPGVGSTDAQLSSLIAALKARGIRTGVEVGGTAWVAGFCTLEETLEYASKEQQWVRRWLKLGGTIDSLTTDHASVKNIRGPKHAQSKACQPAVPMADRIK